MAAVAAVAAAGGVHELFDYNRENFHYDRELRFKKELHLLDFRAMKADMWREDIEDIVGITERRMDSYLVVSVLLLDMCVAFLCEGRMEPGTPEFLLDFYLMTLGGAFTYLFFSVWLAMHAMIVAQCASARLLTMYVRLPVPTWDIVEGARSYGAEIEQQKIRRVMRVPFVGRMARKTKQVFSRRARDEPALAEDGSGAAASVGGVAEAERTREDIYELLRTPTGASEHVRLARQASKYYECYDAFARVSMLFGVNQLLNALAYFAIAYCGVQDRTVTGSWCIVLIAVGIAGVVVEVDVTMSRAHRWFSQLLIFTGPTCVLFSSYSWLLYSVELPSLVSVAYFSHIAWLIFSARQLKVRPQKNGALLPLKFRPVLYLNIFEWLVQKPKKANAEVAAPTYVNVSGDEEMGSDNARRLVSPAAAAASPSPAVVGEGLWDVGGTFPRHDLSDPNFILPEMDVPGKVPWRLFRLATALLCCLWLCSLLRPLLGLTSKQQSSPDFIAAAELGEGERVVVSWPGHPGFTPRALSCDTSGKRFLVSDDFGLYAASLPPAPAPLPHNSTTSLGLRSWMSVRSDTGPGMAHWIGARSDDSSIAAGPSPPPRFKHVPACQAVEGKAVLDADVLCPDADGGECQALILSGRNLTMCPLFVHSNANVSTGNSRGKTWKIAGDWLEDSDEKLQSASAGGNCPQGAPALGCVAVGTSSGRIVQLRAHMHEAGSLVPDRNLVPPAEHSEGLRGALHAHKQNVLVLQPKEGLLRAIAAGVGTTASWRLPSNVEWLALSAGGGYLYLLGRSDDGEVDIWRFPMPPELLSAKAPQR